jgi:hypothetical protein
MVFSSLAVNLLQGRVQYFKEDDPQAAFILLVSVAIIVVIGFLVNLVKHGIGKTGNRIAAARPAVRQFSIFALHRLARTYALNREQTKFLEQIFRNQGVREPQRIMKNPVLLDNCFKKAYKTIEKTSENEKESQEKIALLFSLRNTIENAWGMENIITSTRQIADNSEVLLIVGTERYPARVVSSKTKTMSVECLRPGQQNSDLFARGSRVTLSSFSKSGNGLSFDTMIVGTTDNLNSPTLQIAHSDNVKLLAFHRKFRRKQTDLPCTISIITVNEVRQGLKKIKKLSVDKHKIPGNIPNISIGGCAIRTNVSVAAGSSFKIEINFASDARPLAVLGQILRINQNGSRGTIIHIKFTKITRRAWNVINAMVFNYYEG